MRRILHDLKILILTNLWIVPVLPAWSVRCSTLSPRHRPCTHAWPPVANGGGYHAFGVRLQAELALHGFTLELVPSAGSQDNLASSRPDEVELALVQSGQELSLS